MAELTLGSLVVCADDDTLTFRCRDERIASIRIRVEDVGDLVEFLGNIAPEKADDNSSNRRNAFRVPLPSPNDLHTSILFDGETYSATAQDISFTGIAAELVDGEVEGLRPGDEVSLILRLGDKHVSLAGVVRRCNGRTCGIFFPDTVRGEEIEPPQTLVDLVRELERQWLARRVERS